jgi:penicillin-binding protein 2
LRISAVAAPSSPSPSGQSPGLTIEQRRAHDPRVTFFHVVVAVALVVLASGLAYQQLLKVDAHAEAERVQNQRRIVHPGPRGQILDREGRVLAGNRPRFSVRLLLDALRPEIRSEQIRIRRNYRQLEDAAAGDLPSAIQILQIARATVVQRYLDQVNTLIGRAE